MCRKTNFAFLAFLLIVIVVRSAFSGEKYPSKPVNLYIGFSPGGSTDLVARVIGEKMGAILGQPLVPINKPGGGTTVEAALLAQAKPDGYTIGTLTTFAITLIPHQRVVPYKPLSDFSPIIQVGLHPMGLCVKPDSPWKTLKEFVAYAKANPGKVSYSTTGAGTHQHIVMEWLAKKEGVQWKHVPYPGGADATTAVLGGHVTATSGAASHVPAVKDGQLRMLAVYEGRRMAEFSEVPTLKECGYDLAVEVGLAFAGPKGLPEPILVKLESGIKQVLHGPEVGNAMKRLEMPIMYRSSKEFQKYLQEEYGQMEKLVNELGLGKKG